LRGKPEKRIEVAEPDFIATRIQWTRDGKAFLYIAENNGVSEIVRQALDRGPVEKVIEFPEEEIFDFGFSDDGQTLAITRGVWQHDVVLINNLNGL